MTNSLRSITEKAVEALDEVISRIDSEEPAVSVPADVLDSLAACSQVFREVPEPGGFCEAGDLIDAGIQKAFGEDHARYGDARKDFVVARKILACRIEGADGEKQPT
jgi:hypothetical protein